MKVIELLEQKQSSRTVANRFECGKTQINSINEKKEEIMEQWKKGMDGKRKVLKPRTSSYHDLNDAIFQWFCAARAKNIPVTGALIQEKALMLALEMGHDEFTASNGWLYSFQKRHNIKQSVLSGEAGWFHFIGIVYDTM